MHSINIQNCILCIHYTQPYLTYIPSKLQCTSALGYALRHHTVPQMGGLGPWTMSVYPKLCVVRIWYQFNLICLWNHTLYHIDQWYTRATTKSSQQPTALQNQPDSQLLTKVITTLYPIGAVVRNQYTRHFVDSEITPAVCSFDQR